MLVLIIFFVVIIGVVNLYKLVKKRKRLFQCMDKFPGDPYRPIIGSLWRFLGIKREDKHEHLKGVFKEFGQTWRMYVADFCCTLMTSKVEHIEVILKDHVNIKKGDGYSLIAPWLGNGLITAGGQLWKNNRRLINPAFHFQILEKYSVVFNAKANELAQILEKHVGQDYIDIVPYIARWGMDIISETAMGVKFNCLENPDSEYANAIFKLCEIFTQRVQCPWLIPDFMFNLSKVGKDFYKCVKIIKNTNMQIIAARREEYKKLNKQTKADDLDTRTKEALLDILLKNEAENKFTDEQICDEVSTFMFAGQDTTGFTVCFALLAIGSHPNIQEKIHQELDNIFHGVERSINSQDLGEMKFLERVIKETLRMFPAVPTISRTLDQDIILDGKVVPAGANVQPCIYQMHHEPEYWPNPEKFDPDRFLPENSVNRHPYAYSPFSAGLRNCIGQKFGSRNAKTVLATILQKFEIASLETVNSIKLYEEIVLKPQVGPHIKFMLRTKN